MKGLREDERSGTIDDFALYGHYWTEA